MDIFQLLKEDHERIKKLFEKVDKTTERGEKTRRELFAKIENELTVHTELEERFFYPRIEDEKATHEITLEAHAEHDAAKMLLEKIRGIDPTDEMWAANMTVLKENVLHHIEEEEGEMFPKARKILGKEARPLGERVQNARR